MRVRTATFLLLVTFAPAAAWAAWNPAGSPVCTASGFQGELLAVPVRAGISIEFQNMLLVWSDVRDTVPGGNDLYFDVVGPLGPDGDDGAPAAMAPGFQGYATAAFTGVSGGHPPDLGGLVLAWADDRNGALDVYARRVTGFGGAWPIDGVPVCTAAGIQSDIQVAGAADGSATVAWLDQRPSEPGMAVYAQRLDSDGNALWAPNGVAVCTVPNTRSQLRIAADPAGGVYVGWNDTRFGPFRTFVLRLDEDGAPAAGWPANGLQVTDRDATALDRLVADGAGGVFVTLWDNGEYAPVAQRLDADGLVHAGWPAAGVAMRGTGPYGFLQDAVAFDGGLVAVWAEDVDPDYKWIELDLRAQRLLGDGTRAAGWGPDGNVLCDAPGDQVWARLADGPRIVAVWEDERSPSSGKDLYALRLLEDGSPDPDWTPNGVLVAGGSGRQYSPRPVWDGLGGVMVGYLDDRNFQLSESDVYAQIVNSRGLLEVPPRLVSGFRLSAPAPNPARAEVTLAVEAPRAVRVRAEVHDALGRRVRVLEPAAGALALRWDLRDDDGRRVEPGVYFVRASAGVARASQTVVVRR